MRALLSLIAVVLSLGAAFDVLITLDLALSGRAASTVGDYLAEGAPLLAWADAVLARAIPDLVLDPVLALAPEWFFPLRAAALTLCAAALFAVTPGRRT